MSTQLLAVSRTFQIWMYKVGHSQLLLRSPKEGVHSTRIDVLFKDVGAIHLPAICEGLRIEEATEVEKQQLGLEPGFLRRADRKMFLVVGSDFSGYVYAGAVLWHEDELEYDDISYFSFTLERPRPSLYERLLRFKTSAAILLSRMKGTSGD